MQVLEETFVRDEQFALQAYIQAQLGKEASGWRIEVEFQAPLYTVQQKIPSAYGTLTETPTGTLFQVEHGDLAQIAYFLITRHLPFVVRQPLELRATLKQIAEEIARSAVEPRTDQRPTTNDQRPTTNTTP
jgi:hypothetical protein